MHFGMRSALALAALVFLAAACDGEPTAPGEISAGSFSFSYAGDASGSFSASGAPTVDNGTGDMEWGSFAVAVTDTLAVADTAAGEPVLFLLAVQAKNRPVGSMIVISVFGVDGAGEYPLGRDCDFDAQDRGACAYAGMKLDADLEAGENLDGYVFESGTLEVTTLTDRVVKGTFAGTVGVYDPEIEERLGEFTVTNGTFELPVIGMAEMPALYGAAASAGVAAAGR